MTDNHQLYKNPIRWQSPKKRSEVVLGHAISIRGEDDLNKEFGVPNGERKQYYNWSCRTQDLFNGERRLIFTSRKPETVLMWINTIN